MAAIAPHEARDIRVAGVAIDGGPVVGSHELEGGQLTVNSTIAALIPLVIVAVGFEIYCFVDLYRAEQVRYFPKWLWAIICLISVPLGGIVYLVVGRER